MAVALKSLRVSTELDASAYQSGAAAKVAADRAMIDSSKAVGVSLASQDAALSKAVPGVSRLSREFISGYGDAAKFEAAVRRVGNALDRGMDPARAATLLQNIYDKFQLAANGADLARQGYVSLAPVVERVNNQFSITQTVAERAEASVRKLSEAQAAQARINTATGVRPDDSGAGTAQASADAFVAAARQQEQAMLSLQAKYNPLQAAQRAYIADLNAVRQAERDGIISSTQLAASVQDIKLAFAGRARELTGAAAREKEAAAAQAMAAREAQAAQAMAAAESAKFAARLDDLRAKADPVAAALDILNKETAEYNALVEQGHLKQGQATALIGQSQKRYNDVAQSMQQATKAGRLMSGEMTNLGFQLNDVITGIMLGQSPFMIMAQQGGQVYQILGQSQAGVGGALKSIGGWLVSLVRPATVLFGTIATVALAAAHSIYTQSQQMKGLRDSLEGIGAITGATVAQLDAAARAGGQIAQLSVGSAREVAGILAANAKTGIENIETLTGAVTKYAQVTKQEVPDAAAELAKAMADPAKGAELLSGRLGTLTGATLANIRTLQAQGNRAGAQKVLTEALAESLEKVTLRTSKWATAWNAVADAYGRFGAAISQGPTLDQQIATAEQRLKDLQSQPVSRLGGRGGRDVRDRQIAEEQIKVDELRAKKAKETADAVEAARRAEVVANGQAAQEIIENANSEAKALEDLTNEVKRLTGVLGSEETKKTMSDFAQGLLAQTAAAEEARRKAMAIDNALGGKEAGAAYRAALDARDLVGLRDYDRALAEINQRFREQTRELDKTSQKYKTLAEARDIALETARATSSTQFMQGINDEIEALRREAEGFSLTGEAAERFRYVQAAINEATRSGIPLTEAMTQKLNDAGEAYAKLAQEKRRSDLTKDIAFERSQIGLPEAEQQIRARLRSVYGDDLSSAAAQFDAQQLRINENMREMADLAKDALSGFLGDLREGKSLGESFLGMLSKIGAKFLDKQMDGFVGMLMGNGMPGGAGGGGGGGFDLGKLVSSVTNMFNSAATKIAASPPPSSSFGLGGGTSYAAPVARVEMRELAAPLKAAAGDMAAAMQPATKSFGLVPDKIAGMLRSIGATETGIAGFLGNIKAESQFNPNALNPKSGAFGLAQWLGPRKKELFAMFGPNPSDDQQIAFMKHEFQTLEKASANMLRASDTLMDGVKAGMAFERPIPKGYTQDQIDREFINPRMKNAQGFTGPGGAPATTRQITEAVKAGSISGWTSVAGTGGDMLSIDERGLEIAVMDGTESGFVNGFINVADVPTAAPASGGGGGMAGGGMGGLLGAGLGGFSAGMQSGSPIMGGLTGAIGGFMAGGPIGAIVGGIGGLLGGLFGQDQQKKQEKKAAQEALSKAEPAIASLRDMFAGKGLGTLVQELREARAKTEEIAQLMIKAGDRERMVELWGEYDAWAEQQQREFGATVIDTIDALNKGIGLDAPFLEGFKAASDHRDKLLGFLRDVEEVYGKDSDMLQTATEAAQGFATAILTGVEPQTEIAQEFDRIQGAAKALAFVLDSLGVEADIAAARIEDGVNVALAKLGDSIEEQLIRDINSMAPGGAPYSAVPDLIEQRDNMVGDAKLTKRDDLLPMIDTWFAYKAQEIINESELVGAAFERLLVGFPELRGVVVEFNEALGETAAELAERIQGYEDRTFAATNDESTLSGALAAFDRDANREREEEIKAGGKAMVALETALAAERLKIIMDFAEQVRQRMKSYQDRAFSAGLDTSTRAGALAEFDRAAQQEIEDEMKLGGEAILDLEKALQAERAAIIKDFADQAIEEEKQRADQIKRITEQAREDWQAWADSIEEWIGAQRAGPQSPLNPQARLAAAQAQYDETRTKALGGDRDALNSMTSMADALLQAGGDYFASGPQFQALWDQVLAQMEDLPNQVTAEEFIAKAIAEAAEDTVAAVDSGALGTVGALNTMSMAIQAAINLGPTQTASALSTYFNALDSNTDGLLTLAELRTAGLMTDAKGQAIFQEIDINGDGFISKMELVRQAVAAGPAATALALANYFNAIDSNTDGLLTKAELSSALGASPLAKNTTVDDLVDWFDDNGDGMLSKAEIQTSNKYLGGTSSGPLKTTATETATTATKLLALAEISNNTGNTAGHTASINNTWMSPIRSNLRSIASNSGGPSYASGGFITGPGTGTSDSVMARVSNGEYVVNAAAVGQYGRRMMDAINGRTWEPPMMALPSFGMNDNGMSMREVVAELRRVGRAIDNLHDPIDNVAMAALASGERVTGAVQDGTRQTKRAAKAARRPSGRKDKAA